METDQHVDGPQEHEGEHPQSSPPSAEAIATRAYALFLARGGVHGDDWVDWLQAEAELQAEATQPQGQTEPGPAPEEGTNQDRPQEPESSGCAASPGSDRPGKP